MFYERRLAQKRIIIPTEYRKAFIVKSQGIIWVDRPGYDRARIANGSGNNRANPTFF